jgi:hypothetical protein
LCCFLADPRAIQGIRAEGRRLDRQTQRSGEKIITDGHIPAATIGLQTIIDLWPEIISFNEQPAIVTMRSLYGTIAREDILHIAIFLVPGAQQPECRRLVWRR